MIVYKNKRYIKCDLFPNSDWIGDADWILDDEIDAQLESKIIGLYPDFDFILDDNGKLVDVTSTDPAPLPKPAPTDHERIEALESAFTEIGAILGGSMMSNFYALQVRMGKISIDDVPAKWKKETEEKLL